MRRFILAGLASLFALTGTAHAAQICSWLVESNEPDDVRVLTVWLQSDVDADFLYKIGGKGIVNHMGYGNSPTDATYSLHAGQAETPWHYGGTLDAPATIDITVEIHQTPTDIFSDAPTPLLAKFTFSRRVPESEKKPPMTLAKKQCATVLAPAH
jgi:hypothetical protein